MASDATDVLHEIGYDFIIKAVRIAFECACYGVYLLLISTSTIILCRKLRRSKAAYFLLIVTLVMFGGSTMFLVIDLIDIIKRFQIILTDHPDKSFQEREHLANWLIQPWIWTGEMLFVFMLILGDSVVIWRTWALFRQSERYLIPPILTWIGSVVAAFYELGCDVNYNWFIKSTTSPSIASVGMKSCARADTASFSLSYATNIICTGLIMYKAWMYRRSMSEYLGAARRRTQVEKIMSLSIESGAIYLVLYTIQAIPIYGGHFSAGSFIAVQAVNAIIQQAMGMYPTAIVVLVEMQKSIYDTEQVTCERGLSGTPSVMVFAARELSTTQAETTSIRETENFHGSGALHSTGYGSKHTASTTVELAIANTSRESIPGKT